MTEEQKKPLPVEIDQSAIARAIKASMNQVVKESNKSRYQVVDQMNALAKRRGIHLSGNGGISKDLFEKWLNANCGDYVPSLKGLAVFCEIMGTTAPIAVFAAPLGGAVIEGDDIRLLKWAKAYHAAKDLRKQMRLLEKE